MIKTRKGPRLLKAKVCLCGPRSQPFSCSRGALASLGSVLEGAMWEALPSLPEALPSVHCRTPAL